MDRQHDIDHSSTDGRIIYDLELNATTARQSNRSTSRDIRNRRVCVCIMHNIKIKRTSRESSFILMFYFYFYYYYSFFFIRDAMRFVFYFYFLRVRLRHHLQFDRCSGGGTYMIYKYKYISSRRWCVYVYELCTYEYSIIYYNNNIVD